MHFLRFSNKDILVGALFQLHLYFDFNHILGPTSLPAQTVPHLSIIDFNANDGCTVPRSGFFNEQAI